MVLSMAMQVGTISPMNWPQLFRCKSGIYVIGTESHFRHVNNVVIAKMLDDHGERMHVWVGWGGVGWGCGGGGIVGVGVKGSGSEGERK